MNIDIYYFDVDHGKIATHPIERNQLDPPFVLSKSHPRRSDFRHVGQKSDLQGLNGYATSVYRRLHFPLPTSNLTA